MVKKILKNPRNAYGEKLVELGEKNKDIVVLDADLSKSTKTIMFAKRFPERFFEMGISFVLWLSAMKLTLSTARISTLIFFSPFLSLVFINFLVGETIRMSTITGLIFIVAGNGLQQMRGSSKRKARS